MHVDEEEAVAKDNLDLEQVETLQEKPVEPVAYNETWVNEVVKEIVDGIEIP